MNDVVKIFSGPANGTRAVTTVDLATAQRWDDKRVLMECGRDHARKRGIINRLGRGRLEISEDEAGGHERGSSWEV